MISQIRVRMGEWDFSSARFLLFLFFSTERFITIASSSQRAQPSPGAEGGEKSCPSKIQLLHIRERPGPGPHREEGHLCRQHHPHLPAGQRRPADRGVWDSRRVGQPQSLSFCRAHFYPRPRWGRLSEGGVLPSILQHVSVPILSNEKCKSMFLKAGRHEVIPEIFMCAGYENGKMDSCQVFFCNMSIL